MLAVEALIRARLAQIPDVPGGVTSMSDLSLEAVSGRRFPALFVGSLGYRIDDAKSPGAVRIASQWLVVVAVRHVADARGGSDARAAASDLAAEVMSRLYRWQPDGHAPLLPITPPKPEYSAGVLLYPLAFECPEIIERSAS
jgi:hypothetical protein